MKVGYNYVPIIKGKMYDLDALNKLTHDVKTTIKPLIELMPIDNRNEITIEAHLEKFIRHLDKRYATGDMFLDFYGFLPGDAFENDKNAVIRGFERLLEMGRKVTPVYGFERNDSIWKDFKEIVEQFGEGFCFRVSIDDLDDLAEDTWEKIIQSTEILGLKPAEVDILIDLRYIGDKNIYSLNDMVIDFISLNQNVSTYRNIILSGSSALKTVTQINKDSMGVIRRNEIDLWLDLQRDVDDSLNITFSDYGVVHPDFTSGGNAKNINAKVRHTVDKHILYFRGHGLNNPVKDYEQYHSLADMVVEDERYKGPSFSYGAEYIRMCADKEIKPGNPATWVRTDMNHHVTHTAKQMINIRVQLELESQDVMPVEGV